MRPPEVTRQPMDSDTWKAFCRAILSQVGPPMDNSPIERPEFKFKCDRCAMEFQTAMKLDSKVHRALQNKCGGTWKILGDGAK
jgi:hypothetical protein